VHEYLRRKPECGTQYPLPDSIEHLHGCSLLRHDPQLVEEASENDSVVNGTGRLDAFYFRNSMFLEADQLISHMDCIAHLPAMIVQGGHDVIAPPCWKPRARSDTGLIRAAPTSLVCDSFQEPFPTERGFSALRVALYSLVNCPWPTLVSNSGSTEPDK